MGLSSDLLGAWIASDCGVVPAPAAQLAFVGLPLVLLASVLGSNKGLAGLADWLGC
jgi:hypothetical protein